MDKLQEFTEELGNIAKNSAKIGNTTLQAADRVIESTGDAASAALNIGKHGADTVSEVAKTGTTSLQIAQRLGLKATDITEQLSTSVTDNTDTALNTLNTGLSMTNSTLQQISPHLSKTVGNSAEVVSGLSSTFSKATTEAAEVGGLLFSTVLIATKAPFDLAKNYMTKEVTFESKIKQLKRDIANHFSTTQSILMPLFKTQLTNIITICDNFIKDFKQIACSKSWGRTVCKEDIQLKIDAMTFIKTKLQGLYDMFIKNSSSYYTDFMGQLQMIQLSDGIPDGEKLVEFQNKSSKIKTDVIIKMTQDFNGVQTEFNTYLQKIKNAIIQLEQQKLSILDSPPPASASVPAAGGRKTRRRKSKKARKSKRRIKNSRKSI